MDHPWVGTLAVSSGVVLIIFIGLLVLKIRRRSYQRYLQREAFKALEPGPLDTGEIRRVIASKSPHSSPSAAAVLDALRQLQRTYKVRREQGGDGRNRWTLTAESRIELARSKEKKHGQNT